MKERWEGNETNKQTEGKENEQTNEQSFAVWDWARLVSPSDIIDVRRTRSLKMAYMYLRQSNQNQVKRNSVSLPPPYVKWISLIKLSWALLMFIGPLVDFYQLYYSAI